MTIPVVATVLATMVLGQETKSIDEFGGLAPILLPMLIAGVGILFSIVGTLFVRINDSAGINTASVQKALNMGNWGSMVLTAIAAATGFFSPAKKNIIACAPESKKKMVKMLTEDGKLVEIDKKRPSRRDGLLRLFSCELRFFIFVAQYKNSE